MRHYLFWYYYFFIILVVLGFPPQPATVHLIQTQINSVQVNVFLKKKKITSCYFEIPVSMVNKWMKHTGAVLVLTLSWLFRWTCVLNKSIRSTELGHLIQVLKLPSLIYINVQVTHYIYSVCWRNAAVNTKALHFYFTTTWWQKRTKDLTHKRWSHPAVIWLSWALII